MGTQRRSGERSGGMNEQLLREAREMGPVMESIFTTLHENPELGNGEEKTAELIRQRLRALGLEVMPMVGTGTVAILRGGHDGPTVGFRADIDALPVAEADSQDADIPFHQWLQLVQNLWD